MAARVQWERGELSVQCQYGYLQPKLKSRKTEHRDSIRQGCQAKRILVSLGINAGAKLLNAMRERFRVSAPATLT